MRLVRPLQINFLFPIGRPCAFDDLTQNISIIRTRKCRVSRSHKREKAASVYDRCCSQSVLSWTILMTVFPRVAFTSDRHCIQEGHLARLLCNIGISRPPACLCNGLEDGKQGINLEWP